MSILKEFDIEQESEIDYSIVEYDQFTVKIYKNDVKVVKIKDPIQSIDFKVKEGEKVTSGVVWATINQTLNLTFDFPCFVIELNTNTNLNYSIIIK